MKVLSLFDGIACGMVALERAGIPVERYVAYEYDIETKKKYAPYGVAAFIASKNYPIIEQKGNVFDGDYTQYKGFDLLIGGSPCTHWSIANKNRETTANGLGFKLFMQYVRALKESECKYFFYENNYSISKEIKAEITKHLGVEPIMINSSLVSAQERKRCYWTNIPNVTQPENKHIYLKDILGISNDLPCKEIANYCNVPLTLAEHWFRLDNSFSIPAAEIWEALKQCLNITETKYDRAITEFEIKSNVFDMASRIYNINGKHPTLTTLSGGHQRKTITDGEDLFYLEPVHCERLQTIPDNYTAGVSDRQRFRALGNGWTASVISHVFSFIPECDRTQLL